MKKHEPLISGEIVSRKLGMEIAPNSLRTEFWFLTSVWALMGAIFTLFYMMVANITLSLTHFMVIQGAFLILGMLQASSRCHELRNTLPDTTAETSSVRE